MQNFISKIQILLFFSFPFLMLADSGNKLTNDKVTSSDSLGQKVDHFDFGADLYVSDFEDVEDLIGGILAKHKGKSIILDLWGTFCPPCLADFKNSSDIKKQLREMDVVVVYLCAGRSSKPDKWKELIQEYQLVGDHIYMDSEMTTQYMTKFNFKNYPGYLFVDKDGKFNRYLIRGIANIHPPSFKSKL